MMDAGILHRQALYMHFALADPTLGNPWYRRVTSATFGRQLMRDWEYPYHEIAPGKNAISGRTGQLSRLIQEFQSDQLVDGDTEFWGNWMHWPILVSCSGVMPWYDTAFASAAGSMVMAELEKILYDEYGMTAKEAGLVTGDGTTIPVFNHQFGMTDKLEDLRVDGAGIRGAWVDPREGDHIGC